MLPFLLPLNASAGRPLVGSTSRHNCPVSYSWVVDFSQRFPWHVPIPLLLPDQVQNKEDEDGHESVGGE
jgi:hypothetical protein